MTQSLRVHVTQFVGAPIARVYAAYINPELMPKWMGTKAITNASGPLDQPGTTFTTVVFGPHRPRCEVLAAEPPVLHDMGGLVLRAFYWRWTAHFAQVEGGTQMAFDTETTFPAGPVGRWVRRSEEGRIEPGMRQRLEEFAKLVEAGET